MDKSNGNSIENLLIDCITNPNKKVVFFVGAGVSIDSGLPNFGKFSESFLQSIMPEDWEEKFKQETCKKICNKLRPEVLLQVIYQVHEERSLDFYASLESDNPSRLHYFLALALKTGNYVFTTNVDTLIETACSRLDVSCNPIAHESDFDNFLEKLSNNHNKQKVNLFKLHGSIEKEKKGRERYESIRFTINRVGLGLTKSQSKILSFFLENYDFVFIGYSGNDHFSVLPVLIDTISDKEIFWLKYESGKIDPEEADREKFEDSKEELLEALSAKSIEENKTMKNLENLSILEILLSRKKSTCIYCDCSPMLEKKIMPKMKDNDITPLNIQKDIEKIEELLNSSSNERPDAEKFIPKWVNSVPDFQRHILAAMLLIRARILKDDLDKALEQAKECAGDNSEKKAYVEQIRRTLLSLTRDLSDPEFKSENLKNIRDDIEIFTTKGDITSAIETYLTLINRCRIDRDFGVAKEELKRAHKLLNMNKSYFESEGRGFDWSRLMAELYFLHALVYGLGLQGNIYDKLEAIRYCAEAEKLATLTGDVSRKAAILNVRGLLLYQLAERSSEYLNEAEKSFDKSFELHLRIGDPRLTFQPLRNRILAQRLRALHSKHLARKYWLDKAGKSCYYARQQLNQMELKKEVISADMKEIIYQEFKIKGLQGNKKDACTSLEKEVLKYWEERKDLHQQARIWQDLMKLAHDNDSEKNYFASLLSIISAIFEDIENGSDRYRNDILRFENIRDMLIDAYMIAHKNEDHTGRQSVVRLMKKGEDFAKKYRFEALTQDFKIWSSAN